MKIENWKNIPYSEAWNMQIELFNSIIKARSEGQPYENHLIFCSHPHVYTIGKHGKRENMLIGSEMLARIGAEVFRIDRGGDITYHGPGQLVCYPILCLEDFNLGLKDYIHLLEEAVIRTCLHYGIASGRVEGATGVWLDHGTPGERKICAIGVRSSHFVTMHGLALNVNTDLNYFNYINPCGFVDKGVTSIEKETGASVPMDDVREILEKELLQLF